MTEQSATSIDPVCGMTVDTQTARAVGLVAEYHGGTYFFCGKGCLLDFRDDPETVLDPNNKPAM